MHHGAWAAQPAADITLRYRDVPEPKSKQIPRELLEFLLDSYHPPSPPLRARSVARRGRRSPNMPAVDPFSASSRPMNLFDSAPSDPLLFASTLQTLDPNIPSLTASTSSLGLGRPSSKARQYREPLPTAFPAPIWTRHERSSSVSSEAVLHGSDEWMDGQLRKCIDKAEPELNLR